MRLKLKAMVATLLAGLLGVNCTSWAGSSNHLRFQNLESLARQGNKEALFDLGVLYANGEGVDQSYARGLKYLWEAALRGYGPAYTNIGLFYYYGLGLNRDYQKAFSYFEKGAKHDDPQAYYNLAVMLDNGQGVSKNPAQALAYFEEAARRQYLPAISSIACKYLLGLGVEKDEKKAFDLYHDGALRGDVRSQSNLIFMYLNGVGTPRDVKEAYYWGEKVSHSNDPEGLMNYGVLLEKGYNGSPNVREALAIYERACELGSKSACEGIKRLQKRYPALNKSPAS